MPLRKHYADGFKIADSSGKFYPNSTFHLFSSSDQEHDFEIESKITNIFNITYYGKLWFSNSNITDELEFIFDTGSSWLWASTPECFSCPFDEYLPSSQYYD